jgi:L-asparaginase / beta-aspartyl-peptidase
MGAAIIVHGGAKTVKPEKAEANRQGCLSAVAAGWAVLREGGAARDAVTAAICSLETNPVFNASFGATLDVSGEISLDAAIMEGNTMRWGGVAAVQSVRHPILAANKLLDEKHLLLVGPKAEAYALEQGCEMCLPPDLISTEQQEEWESEAEVVDRPATVGCVALDEHGIWVAGTSTGGLTGQKPGRVGDSAIVGSGLYANRFGGCSTTGDGESIMTVVLAKAAVDFLSQGCDPNEAAERAIAYLKAEVEGEAGCILIDPQGRVGWAYNSDHMPIAYMNHDLQNPVMYIERPALV